MDTEKQRQHRRDDARLTDSGNARSAQLNTRGAYRVANGTLKGKQFLSLLPADCKLSKKKNIATIHMEIVWMSLDIC